MAHQPRVMPVIEDQISLIVGKGHALPEAREKVRQAGIDRVTHAMDDPGAREHTMDADRSTGNC